MPLPLDTAILWPIAAVVALTFLSAVRLITLRMRAMRSKDVRLTYYKTYRDGAEPEAVAAATRHYANLFEMPMLFYLVCVISALLGDVGLFSLVTAWGFVVFRVIQSAVHLTSNNVRQRAYAFFTSCGFLLLLWGSTVWSLASR